MNYLKFYFFTIILGLSILDLNFALASSDSNLESLVKLTVVRSQLYNPASGDRLDESQVVLFDLEKQTESNQCQYLVDGFVYELGLNPKPIFYFLVCVYPSMDQISQAEVLEKVLFTPN